MKGSDLLVRCLQQEGVTTVFGVPGEETLALTDSLLDSGIRFVTCRHERGAAFMADVWGRLTGRAGVRLATLGPVDYSENFRLTERLGQLVCPG